MKKKYKNLEEKIKKKIYQHGPITIEDYMSMCLQDEEYGYYKYKKPIGADGDFITCLLYTSPSPRDRQKCRMPSSA